MDPLSGLGIFKGSHGAPGARVQLGVQQVQRAIRSRARTGQALGDAAVQLTRGAFFRNLQGAGSAVARACGFGGDCGNVAGNPPAPPASGWDGRPLDGS